jgi:hypothetical protein
VSDQGPRRNTDGSTRQGIYIFTASGKLLVYKNHQDPDVMRDVMMRGLVEWQKLPKEQRRPGAVKVEELTEVDKRYSRTPPPDALIATVYTRILDADGKGGYCKGSCKFTGGDQSARDHLWLTKTDWQCLVPRDAKKGDTIPMPARIAQRLARYHLVDNTRGEPPFWKADEVRKVEISMLVEEASEKTVRLKVTGAALMATDADPAKAKRGYDATLSGVIVYDVEKKVITRFDLVAVGDHWGQGTYTPGARPGRQPLGVAFELARGKPADLVPPQAARDYNDYIGK